MSIKLLLQYIVPQRLFSKALGFCANHRIPFVSRPYTKYFLRRYQVDMQEAVHEKLDEYKTFNALFTRHLKPGLRPIEGDEHTLVSPVDGTLSEFGPIKQDKLIQAKGIDYSLLALLAGEKSLADTFLDGDFATFYLSPRDYHRVHMPLSATLKAVHYVPGKLFSVSPFTAENISGLFVKNERAIFVFETAVGPMVLIMVGAIIVSSICTAWSGKLKSTRLMRDDFSAQSIQLARGEEMGHFELGSTVIVLTPKNVIRWCDNLKIGQPIKLGNKLAETLRNH